jgi:DNA-binding transcriptional ArsR family regulator
MNSELFRLLGDAQRLRILRLLGKEKLNVTELVGILGIAQSGVSRHLRLLRDAGLVREDREGGWAYFEVSPEKFPDGFSKLWPVLQQQLHELDGARQDDVRLQEVLRQRREDFRDSKTNRAICPGRSWASWARTLSYLVPQYTVADLGCGEGYLTMEVARWARKVIAVDSSPAMLKHAKKLAQKYGVKNVTFRRASVEKVPLTDGSVDVVLLSQVLHCLAKPEVALEEASRILKNEGTLLVQELRRHQEEWARDRFGDVWLGFEEKELNTLLRKSNFTDVQIDIGSKRRGDPFVVLIARATKNTKTPRHEEARYR